MSQKIYLDYAAATPYDSDLLAKHSSLSQELYLNPNALYQRAVEVDAQLEEARAKVAKCFGARPGEIIFTSGATEANNILLQGVKAKYQGKIICSQIEHKAVINLCDETVAVDDRGLVNIKELKEKIDDQVVALSLMLVNNETGVVQDFSEIKKVIAKIRDDRLKRGIKMPLIFHSDASQAGNLIDLHISRLGVDALTVNSAKLYGPRQFGCLYLNSSIELEPIIKGGKQERGLRPGTQDVATAVVFADALKKAQSMHRSEFKRLDQLTKNLIKQLQDIASLEVIHNKNCLPSLISIIVPGLDGERLVMALDFAGFEVGTGAACSALENDSSHVLKALGYSEEEARSSLRISLGRASTTQQLDQFIEALKQVIAKEQELS